MRLRGLFTVLLMAGPELAQAAQIISPSCEYADVDAAVKRAAARDEVLIPAGTCTWTQTLSIDKPLTLRGAGPGLTTLIDQVNKLDADGTVFLMELTNAVGTRVSDFTIQGAALDSLNNNYGYIRFDESAQDIRVDHLTFVDMKMPGIVFYGGATGVVDHCAFGAGDESGVNVYQLSWDGGWYGDNSWAADSALGTSQALFVEDCTFSPGYIAFNAAAGSRVVVRHNSFTNVFIYVSGADSAGRFRSARHAEVYSNRFVTESPPVVFSGGTGVLFDNSFEGAAPEAVRLEVLRATASFSPWGRCNGQSAFDGNQEASGYPCFDQIGRGKGDLLSGDTPAPRAWPQQALEPLYVWGNAFDGGAQIYNASPAVIKSGRDYIEGQPRPNYQPFTYPHPLVQKPDGGPDPRVDGGPTVDDSKLTWKVVGCSCGAGSFSALGLGWMILLWFSIRRLTAKRS